jgi:hypothetical protein
MLTIRKVDEAAWEVRQDAAQTPRLRRGRFPSAQRQQRDDPQLKNVWKLPKFLIQVTEFPKRLLGHP